MRIAIAGGTGTLGSHLTGELRSRGHEVRVLSRSAPEYRVDLRTGAGLGPALEGCDVVVDASNNASRKAAQVLAGGTRRLLDAERAAGVGHHVCVSIVGCDQVPMGYYRVKTDQENLVAQGPVPWTIVRATQFHELVAKAFETAARWRVLPAPRALLQPIAAAEVAGYVAGLAGAAAAPGTGCRRGTRGVRAAHAGPHLALGHRPRARAASCLRAGPGRPGPAGRDAHGWPG